MKERLVNFLLTVYGILLMAFLVLVEFTKWVLSFFSIPRPKPATPTYYAKVLWRNFALVIFFIWFYFQAVDINLFWLFGKSPGLADLEKPKMALASEVYSADGVLLGKYYRENRSPTEYKSISPFVVKALLATEDITFTEHTGVDLGATIGIVYYLIKGDKRGGSTITQQLAKNLYKTRKKENLKGVLSYIPGLKTLVEKTKEWITATKLERNYTKEEILTMYLNTVDFGSNSYGIRTAAQTFFKTTPGRLKIEEAAVLVGMLKATTTYNPKKNYEKSLKRRNTVLAQMRKYNFISSMEFDSLSGLPIKLNYTQEPHPDGVLDYYGSYLTKVLTEWADSNDHDIYTDGLKIYLTIDTRFQKHAEDALHQHMRSLQKRFDDHWRGQNPWRDERHNEIPGFIEQMAQRTETYKSLKRRFGENADSINKYLNLPKKMVLFSWRGPDTVMMSTIDSLKYCKKILHAGFMVMDPFRGQIKAWIGGIDYKFFKYDHVEQSVRQPGSTFKPFVYGAAMENGYNPCSRIQDRYVKYEYDEDSAGVKVHKTWAPTNATGYFTGTNMTLRFAMGRSINSVAAQLTNLLGAQKVADFAHKCGISSPLKATPSIGLGSNDVSVFEMVGAYGSFLNNGFWNEPMIVGRIEDHNRNLIRNFTPKTQKVMSEEAAYKMVHMLKGTLQEPGGTAQALFSFNIFYGNEMGGKTGTSSNQSDGWFMGLTKDLVGGIWVGAEERCIHFRSLRAGEGSKTALPIFGLFMEKVYRDKSLGIRVGFFPKKKYPLAYCPTRIPKKDTSSAAPVEPGPPEPEELELE
jgi:penicillin-binding protein 1A